MNATPIKLSELAAESARRKAQGWRLVTITCVPLADGDIDLLYHFDKDLALEHLRLTVTRGAELPSLCPEHPGAFLVENEIQGQFGLRFTGLVPDFGQGLFLEPEVRLSPLAAYAVTPKPEADSAKPGPEPGPPDQAAAPDQEGE